MDTSLFKLKQVTIARHTHSAHKCAIVTARRQTSDRRRLGPAPGMEFMSTFSSLLTQRNFSENPNRRKTAGPVWVRCVQARCCLSVASGSASIFHHAQTNTSRCMLRSAERFHEKSIPSEFTSFPILNFQFFDTGR